MQEIRKTCSECGEERSIFSFPYHPFKLYSSRCDRCFPMPKKETVAKALEVAESEPYPGRIYYIFMNQRAGAPHWRAAQDRIISMIKSVGEAI